MTSNPVRFDKTSLRREQFPVTEKLVYFNHAAVGPLSRDAAAAMQRHATDQLDSGALNWRAWEAGHAHFRALAGRLINASPAEISILKNTSEGLSFVAEGLRWKAGDNVITTDLEFPSNSTPWRRLDRKGVECRIVPSIDGSFSTTDIAALIDGRTRLVTVSSAAFHNGFAPDLVEIGELCSSKNVLFCVDAIQSLGALPMDVKAARISFLASDGHKWLLGPEGTAIFFCAEAARDELEVLETGWMNLERGGKFIDCNLDFLPDGRRFEAGSINTNGVYGLNASMELLLSTGIDVVRSEVLAVAESLAAGAEKAGYRIHSPRPLRSGIVAVTPEEGDRATILRLHRLLEARGIICAPREGMLRFSPHFYNDENDVARVVEVLQELR